MPSRRQKSCKVLLYLFLPSCKSLSNRASERECKKLWNAAMCSPLWCRDRSKVSHKRLNDDRTTQKQKCENEWRWTKHRCLSVRCWGLGAGPHICSADEPLPQPVTWGRDQIPQNSVLAEGLLTRLLIGQSAAPACLIGRCWQLPLTPRIPCLILALPSPALGSTVWPRDSLFWSPSLPRRELGRTLRCGWEGVIDLLYFLKYRNNF